MCPCACWSQTSCSPGLGGARLAPASLRAEAWRACAQPSVAAKGARTLDGPAPRSPGIPRRPQGVPGAGGGAGQPCSPSSVPGLCPSQTARTLTLEILEVLWVLVGTFPASFSLFCLWQSRGCGTYYLRDVWFPIRCLFCDDLAQHPLLSCLSEHCVASLSAFQAFPSLHCMSLSFTPFPHFFLCRTNCRLCSRPCQRPWEFTGCSGPGGSCPRPAPAFSCPIPQEPSGVGLGLPSGVSMVPLLLGSGLLGLHPGILHGPSAVCLPAQPSLPCDGHSAAQEAVSVFPTLYRHAPGPAGCDRPVFCP